MNLSVFVKVKLLEIDKCFAVRTFDSVQFLGLSNGPDEIGFKDFRNVSLLARTASTSPESEGSPLTQEPCFPLQKSLKHNLLSESQKLIEFDSLNALFNEGTNHYNKHPFIPLSTKKIVQAKVSSDRSTKLRAKDMKNGRLFELKDNVLFVDLMGETVVGNPEQNSEDSELFSRGKWKSNWQNSRKFLRRSSKWRRRNKKRSSSFRTRGDTRRCCPKIASFCKKLRSMSIRTVAEISSSGKTSEV